MHAHLNTIARHGTCTATASCQRTPKIPASEQRQPARAALQQQVELAREAIRAGLTRDRWSLY